MNRNKLQRKLSGSRALQVLDLLIEYYWGYVSGVVGGIDSNMYLGHSKTLRRLYDATDSARAKKEIKSWYPKRMRSHMNQIEHGYIDRKINQFGSCTWGVNVMDGDSVDDPNPDRAGDGVHCAYRSIR